MVVHSYNPRVRKAKHMNYSELKGKKVLGSKVQVQLNYIVRACLKQKSREMANAHNPSTWEVEAERLSCSRSA